MSKGIAIQTILMLLVGILVVGIIVYMVYRYMLSPGLSEQECRGRLISWCTTCATMGWKQGIGLSSEVAQCTTKYLGYTVATGIDCDDNIGTVGGSCSVGGASPTCPNVTICRVVGAGT